MTKPIKSYRYQLHRDETDLVMYQRKASNGVWQTLSVWMIPWPAARTSA